MGFWDRILHTADENGVPYKVHQDEVPKQDQQLLKKAAQRARSGQHASLTGAQAKAIAKRGKPSAVANTSSGTRAVYPIGGGMDRIVTFDNNGNVVSVIEQGHITY